MRKILAASLNGLAAILAAAGIGTAFAEAPSTIHYQGFLTTPAGQPVDGTVSLQARIYAASSGGSPIWAETHASVAVAKGVFAVTLGSITPLDTSLLDGPRWVSVGVNADPEMPRQPLASVPYAFVAKRAEALAAGATVPGSQVETGSITDAQVSGSAAIAGSKLAIAGAFLSGRVAGLGTSSGVEYAAATGPSVGTAVETDATTLSPAVDCTASRLAVRLSAAPGAGNAREFTLRTNQSSTLVSCVVSDAATACNSGVASEIVASASELSLQVSSVGTPAATNALFGWVCK